MDIDPSPQNNMSRQGSSGRSVHFEGKRGRKLAFIGGKGGVGTTTIASEFSAFSAARGHQTLAIDLDFMCGDLHIKLDSGPYDGFPHAADIAAHASDIEPSHYGKLSLPTPSGVRLIKPPPFHEHMNPSIAADFASMLDSASQAFDILVIDFPPTRCQCLKALATAIDSLILVTTPEIPAVLGIRTLCQSLGGPSPFSTSLIVNRSFGRKDLLNLREIEGFTGLRVLSVIPDARHHFRNITDQGYHIVDCDNRWGRLLRSVFSAIIDSLMAQGPLEENRSPKVKHRTSRKCE